MNFNVNFTASTLIDLTVSGPTCKECGNCCSCLARTKSQTNWKSTSLRPIGELESQGKIRPWRQRKDTGEPQSQNSLGPQLLLEPLRGTATPWLDSGSDHIRSYKCEPWKRAGTWAGWRHAGAKLLSLVKDVSQRLAVEMNTFCGGSLAIPVMRDKPASILEILQLRN